MAKLLSPMSLEVSSLAETCFELDQSLNKFELRHSKSREHIFITGLARVETTILMWWFYANRNSVPWTTVMSFVLPPNMWHNISNLSTKEMGKIEQAHPYEI